MKSTRNLLFWCEAKRTNDEHSTGHCDIEFATDIRTELDNGITKNEETTVVFGVDWTDDMVIAFAIGQDVLLTPQCATQVDCSNINPMRPSGEVGRFQMHNPSSPPGDWWRSVNCYATPQ
ncbi:hypothetical protein FHS27_003094 [Rhodopirellula rubra]|uniref:Uncharacterized protein n=1 Tax=Aporhodopirellula rubra TaxID=980271 RepID=A0A7W5DZ97_9BACT|nr:hypothetical protein [Aporhodopirellula rubra]